MSKKFHQVFKPGKYPQGDWPEGVVKQIAEGYDPTFCEAPITLDHHSKGPAYGWVDSAKFEDGHLLVAFRDIADELVQFVDGGQYRKVSVEFFKDLDGKGPYLKAVTFLGAATPAVRGLEPVVFKDGASEVLTFELPTAGSDLAAENARLKAELEAANKKVEESTVKFAELDANEKKAREELSRLSLNRRRDDFATFLNEQIAWGNVMPKHKATILQLLEALDGVAQFADGKAPAQVFMDMLKELPKIIDNQEHATREKQDPPTSEVSEFSGAVDQASLELHKKAMRLVEKEKIPYIDAVHRVRKEGK